MASYLIQASYTPEAWAAQVKNPQNRIEALRPVVAQSGGKIVCGYYTFGEYDIMLIVEGMGNGTAAGPPPPPARRGGGGGGGVGRGRAGGARAPPHRLPPPGASPACPSASRTSST